MNSRGLNNYQSHVEVYLRYGILQQDLGIWDYHIVIVEAPPAVLKSVDAAVLKSGRFPLQRCLFGTDGLAAWAEIALEHPRYQPVYAFLRGV